MHFFDLNIFYSEEMVRRNIARNIALSFISLAESCQLWLVYYVEFFQITEGALFLEFW